MATETVTPVAGPLAATALVEGYERLRAQAMAGQAGSWRLGHGLLLGKGLAAWLAVCAATLNSTAAATPPSRGAAATTVPETSVAALGGAPAAALVSVLAQMALVHSATSGITDPAGSRS